MGTVVIHAGMPKAGSSAVQEWLRDSQDELEQNGVRLLSAPMTKGAGRVDVEAYRGGHVNAGTVIEQMRHHPGQREALATQFVSGLARCAEETPGTVVISSEAFAQPFWKGDALLLGLFEDLAARHSVVVAYYVRPQHSALEAAWRQWGFRTPRSPSEYVTHRASQLDYLATLDTVAQLAPSIDFRMRPFRRDLLEGGDVVDDFATQVLGVQGRGAAGGADTNVGLPLELVNLLADAPKGLLGDTPHDNRRFRAVKRVLADAPVATDPTVTRGQEVLQHWCHAKFEKGNLALAERLGWGTDTFVPEADGEQALIDRLDDLWRPNASSMERWAFFQFLEEALDCGERPPDEGLRERLRSVTAAADELRADAADARRRGDDLEDRLRQIEGRRAVRLAMRVAAGLSRMKRLRAR